MTEKLYVCPHCGDGLPGLMPPGGFRPIWRPCDKCVEQATSHEPIQTVVADPPWPFDDRLRMRGYKRGSGSRYPLMGVDDIRLYYPRLLMYDHRVRLQNDAHLYLWTPNAFVGDAWHVASCWGFVPKYLVTWVKTKRDAGEVARVPDDVAMGMGRHHRLATEHVVFAVRGVLPPERRDQLNVIAAPRREHSEKPEEFYDAVERVSPGPYLELFARRRREGWLCLGNELLDD